MSSTRGRQVVQLLTNKSGGGVVAGDVVIIDTANDTAFTTTTTGQAEVSVGIAQETIANNGTGRVLTHGYAALVNVPASVTRGHYIETHTVAKQATGSATRRAGSFGQFFTGGTTPTGWLWGQTDQTASGGSGTVTTVKDEGSNLSTAVTSIDFVGAGVTATGTTAVTVTIPGGGGGLTQSYMGYNTVGGSVESMTSSRWYAKKITTTGACELLSVQAYLTQITNVNAHLMAAAVWDHNSTKPGLLLASAFIGAGTAASIAINKNSAPGTARWFGLPMGLHLSATTDYWIGFMVTLNSGAMNLSYDGSGTDRYMTATGMYATDWDYFTDNSTTNKYSIRANTIA